MSSIAPPGALAIDRATIGARLAAIPSLAELLTEDDLARQVMLAKDGEPRPAAILLLVVNHPTGQSVVFTQRTAHLSDHAGQISFPGGRCDTADCTPERTALREAEEEIGLAPERVEVLGRLPDYHTGTGYRVSPVVGWAQGPLAYRPDPHEVESVFEVPLPFLLDTRNHRYESAFQRGRVRHYWAVPYGDRYIWGATAGMLVTFQRVMAGGAGGGD
jgi:8-oxo-dGTP pyrophosphatase MutT (NUDIX family)